MIWRLFKMAEHEKLDKDYLFKTAIRMIGEAEGFNSIQMNRFFNFGYFLYRVLFNIFLILHKLEKYIEIPSAIVSSSL